MTKLANDFVSEYMRLCNIHESEAPAIYHRWVCLSMMGAYLGRQVHIDFGIGNIYPNQYIMLMGSPGTRKGSAMAVGKRLLKAAGYTNFAADKTSKERFLMDMKQFSSADMGTIEDLEDLVMEGPSESYICAGEFTDFIGQGNMEFVTLLTNLWDNLEQYKQPKITGKSVTVFQPTVNLLGGNTPEGFSLAFPPEALGNGFLSRVLMLHAEPTTNRITWPEPPDELLMATLADRMREVRANMEGQITVSVEAKKIGELIYKNELPVDDARFTHYQQRRFIHLLKIAMLLAVYDLSKKVEGIHLKRANTMLAMAERHMPRALGEFGASRHSMVAGKILAYLAGCHVPQNAAELWRIVSRDLSKMTDLVEILQGLKQAEKIQVKTVLGKAGYLPMFRDKKEWPDSLMDLDWLTELELM